MTQSIPTHDPTPSPTASSQLTGEVTNPGFPGHRDFPQRLIRNCLSNENEVVLGLIGNTSEMLVRQVVETAIPSILISLSCLMDDDHEQSVWQAIRQSNGNISSQFTSLLHLGRSQYLLETGTVLVDATMGSERFYSLSRALQTEMDEPSIRITHLLLSLVPYVFGSIQQLLRENSCETKAALRSLLMELQSECIRPLREPYIRDLSRIAGFSELARYLPEPAAPKTRPRREILLFGLCLGSMLLTILVAYCVVRSQRYHTPAAQTAEPDAHPIRR